MGFAIDREYIIAQTQAMVGIDSVNSDLETGAAGEGVMAQYVADSLRDIGVEPQIQSVEPGRDNVLGVIKGQGNGRSLMLNAHTDTVGVTGMSEPFSGELRDGRIYGRGSYDMKGSLASMLAVMKALTEARVQLAGDLWFTAVVDEEYGSKGTEHLLRHLKTDAAILTEPTNLRVCVGHRGFVWIEVKTFGRAAHGSRYQEGIDANMHMGRLLVEIERLSRELIMREGHPLLGPPSIHVPLIEGGTSQSVYSAFCRIEIERRILPGDTVAGVVAEIQAIVDRLSDEDPRFNASVKAFFSRNAYAIDPLAEIVQTVKSATHDVLRVEPELYGEVWWMDSGLLGEAGIETVIIGPSGDGIHTIEEWVDVDSLVQLSQILAVSAVAYCGLA